MQAIQIKNYGGTEQLLLQDIDVPKENENEVLVQIYAAAINPVDSKVREGKLEAMMNHSLPLTLGWDFSGVIVALGENIKSWKIGDQVYGRPDIAKNGSYAEYIAVSGEEISRKPTTLSWQEAAAVPLVTLTAWQALYEIAQLKAGDRVLIHAGAGGVGIAAIQLAKLRGAFVYTTASNKNIAFLKELGADQVINYQEEDFSELKDLDVVLDTLGGEIQEQCWKTLKKGGTLVSIISTPSAQRAKEQGVRSSFCFVQPNAQQLEEITMLLEAGKLKVEIEKTYSLQSIAAAHRTSENGHVRGKLVLQIKEE